MPSRDNLRIVIADDHPVFRLGLRQIIEEEPGLQVVGDAGDGQGALEMIRTLRPAIAILDIAMPQLDGLVVARELLVGESSVEIIFVTMFREEKLFNTALEAGVKGYVLKDSAATDIVSCIKAVAAGQHYASPALTTYLVKGVRRTAADKPRSGVESLTPTERRVLSLIADYKTSKAIGDELFISPRTVDTHRHNICQKLGIHGSHALMKFALGHKEPLA
jgi:DNA-binding NarL/FixJ family response regulator